MKARTRKVRGKKTRIFLQIEYLHRLEAGGGKEGRNKSGSSALQRDPSFVSYSPIVVKSAALGSF